MRQVFDACRRLSEITDRPVSPDGHLVGSIGEVLAAEIFDLKLVPPSTRGYDATDHEGCKVEIKTTTRGSVALSAADPDAERLIVLRLDSLGRPDVVYDGPCGQVWSAAGKPQKNGQRRISLSTIRGLSAGS